MARHGQISCALKKLNDANRRLAELRENAKNVHLVTRHSLVKDYKDGNFSLLLQLAALRNDEFVTPRLGHGKGMSIDFSPIILNFHVMKKSDVQEWNQEAMFISPVKCVNGPDGIIPSTVRLYVGEYEVVKGTGFRYLSLFQRTFHVVTGRINREFVVVNGLKTMLNDSSDPSIIKSTLQVVNGVSDYQSQIVNKVSVIPKAIFDKLGVTVTILPSVISLRQPRNRQRKIVDMLLGPFDL